MSWHPQDAYDPSALSRENDAVDPVATLREGVVSAGGRKDLLIAPEISELLPSALATHPPRILLLYGSGTVVQPARVRRDGAHPAPARGGDADP